MCSICVDLRMEEYCGGSVAARPQSHHSASRGGSDHYRFHKNQPRIVTNRNWRYEIMTQANAAEMSYSFSSMEVIPATTALVISSWLKTKCRCKYATGVISLVKK